MGLYPSICVAMAHNMRPIDKLFHMCLNVRAEAIQQLIG